MRKREEELSLDNMQQDQPDLVDPGYGGLLSEPTATEHIPVELQLPEDDPDPEEMPQAPQAYPQAYPSSLTEDKIWRRQRMLELALELQPKGNTTPLAPNNLITAANELLTWLLTP